MFDLNIQNFQEINLFDPKRRLVRFGALREPMGYVKKKKNWGGAYFGLLHYFRAICHDIQENSYFHVVYLTHWLP